VTKPDDDPKSRRTPISLQLHPRDMARLRKIKLRMIDDPKNRRPVGNQTAIIYALERVAGESER
jgi:hypothetical protein